MLLTAKLKVDPVHFYLDFEKELTNDAILIGCFFYFKQALRRCMMSIGELAEQVKIEMTENCVDILCIMPKNEILKKGAPCAKCVVK